LGEVFSTGRGASVSWGFSLAIVTPNLGLA
jgi:hypothetical protein